MAFPTLSETQISSLVNIGEKLWVDHYQAPEEDDVIRDAKTVCNIFGWHNIENDASRLGIQKTHLLQDPNDFDITNINWFSLGVVFQYANSYIASLNKPSTKFLRYVVTCFNDVWGWKQWEYRPDGKEWDICRTNEPQNCTVCVKVGEDIIKTALRTCESHELTINDDELW